MQEISTDPEMQDWDVTISFHMKVRANSSDSAEDFVADQIENYPAGSLAGMDVQYTSELAE